MRPFLPLVLPMFWLAGCDSPSPAFMGTPAVEVSVDGSVFRVHRRNASAEAYRISREWLPGRSETLGRGGIAIMRATGCALRPGTLDGDQAIVTADLHCGDGSVPLPEAGHVLSLDCGEVGREGDGIVIACDALPG